LGLGWLVGQDFFPSVDSGQMRLHARGPAGTRIEETERRFADIEGEIRAAIPPDEIEMLIDNIGIPNSWPTIAQGDIPTISSADGEILISLNKESTAPRGTTRSCSGSGCAIGFRTWTSFSSRPISPARFSTSAFPRAIDLQVVGRNAAANYQIAQRLAQRISHIPGAADVHVHQVADQPVIRLDRGSGEGVADGADAARCHQQHADSL
jgi:multidrug efflux pump subunit AcrB